MDLTNKKILVCDDSILARKQLKDAINQFSEGAEFIEAKNGAETITLYKENNPDITFLDIVMPEKDGIAALNEIRSYDSNAIIIIVSSIGTQDQLKEAISAGAKDFIQKPFEQHQIEEVLESRLGGN